MKNLKIRVTAKDIRTGKREQSDTCPVALAVARATGMTPQVYADHVLVWVKDGFYNVTLPGKVQRFIDSFDNQFQVEPFAFTLDLGMLQ